MEIAISLAVISLQNATIVTGTHENRAFVIVHDKISKTIHLKRDDMGNLFSLSPNKKQKDQRLRVIKQHLLETPKECCRQQSRRGGIFLDAL